MPLERPCILAGIPGTESALNGTIRLELDGTPATVAFPGLAPPAFWYVIGDESPDCLLQQLVNVFVAEFGPEELELTTNGNGIVHWDASLPFRILGAHVDTTIDLTAFGLVNGATYPAVAATTFDSPKSHSFGWFPLDLPSDDDLDTLPVVASSSQTVTGDSRIIKLNRTRGRERDFGWHALDVALVRDEYATVDAPYSAFETSWNNSITEGHPFRYYRDTLVRTPTTFKSYRVREFSEPWTESRESALFWDVAFKAIRTDD